LKRETIERGKKSQILKMKFFIRIIVATLLKNLPQDFLGKRFFPFLGKAHM
jgi:hypothetical protein